MLSGQAGADRAASGRRELCCKRELWRFAAGAGFVRPAAFRPAGPRRHVGLDDPELERKLALVGRAASA